MDINTTIPIVSKGSITHPIVYKYRTWLCDNHKAVILDQIVFFPPPSNFTDDSFDCHLACNFLTEKKICEGYLQISKRDYPSRTRQEHRKYARENTKKSPLRDKEFQKNEYEKQFQIFDNNSGVLCLATNACNFAMWDKYADSHKGFCIGFDTQKLFEQIRPYACDLVRYYEKLPKLTPFKLYLGDDGESEYLKDFCEQVFSKEKKWSYEEEYRIYESYSNPDYKRERRVILNKDCFKEVIFGAEMLQEHIDEIISVCKEQNLVVEFYKENIGNNGEIVKKNYLSK